MNRKLLITLVLMGLGLLVLAGVLFVTRSRPLMVAVPTVMATFPPVPTFDLANIPSMEDLSVQHPQLAAILTDPELATVYKEFLVAYQQGGESAALALAEERGVLTPDGKSLRVMLMLDTEESAALQQQLEQIGVTVVSAYQDRVNIAVPIALIQEMLNAEQPGAIFATLTELEHVIAVRLPEQGGSYQQVIEGEGVDMIEASVWHAQDFTGAGVRIGVLDGGFAGYEALLGEELPAYVEMQTFGWIDEEEIHGTACAEIIHEVAPDAELFFAWYDFSYAAMGEAIAWLEEKDVDIISHSGGFFVGPRDGTGWADELVDEQAAKGRLWVNASGNEAEQHYRGTFTDTDGDGYHEFAPDEQALAVYSMEDVLIVLQWDDDWIYPIQDYELYVLDSEGVVLGLSEDAQFGSEGQLPAEGVELVTDGDVVYVSVYAAAVSRAVTFDIFVYGAGVAVAQPSPAYSLGPPSDAAGSLTVGAVNWWDDRLAFYSSQGPAYDGRLKPDLTAPAGVSGETYGEMGFDGTSAATPHVAGSAALVWQAYPGFTRQQVIDYLLNAARDMGPAGPDTGYGYGRLLLPAPPEAVVEVTAIPTSVAVAAEPLSTPTLVAFATLSPPEQTSIREPGAISSLTRLGLIVGGIGCTGVFLLFFSVVMFVRGGRRRRAAPKRAIPSPRPVPQAFESSASPFYEPPVPPQSGIPQVKPYFPPVEKAPPVTPLPVQQEGIRCPSCGTLARAGARFCAVCGSVLGSPPPAPQSKSRYCRYCGTVLRAQSRFCPHCGHAVDN
ncbi:MAG: S8 family serine peptidase [Anaerolineae bacterium]|nr:S8 family serine peptidase [Anaerolineae bacterium]